VKQRAEPPSENSSPDGGGSRGTAGSADAFEAEPSGTAGSKGTRAPEPSGIGGSAHSRGLEPSRMSSDSARPDPEVEFEATEALPRALRLIGTVVAPATLLTGLLFFYGLLYAIGYFRYFGVNFTVLNLPTWNYLVLSADGAIVPLVLLAGVALLTLSIYRLPLERSSGTARLIARWVALPLVAGSGVALVTLALADAVFGISVFPPTFWEIRGLSLAGGTVLMVYFGRLRRAFFRSPSWLSRPPSVDGVDVLTVGRWCAFAILIGVGLFWAVGSYATGMGMRAAQGLAADLACEPDVILYAEKSLNLQVPGVVEAAASRADAAYGFRYEGLKLVPQAGDRYLFLPKGWTPGGRPAILLPRTDKLRMEFIPVQVCGQ
jgi:hypothetical protein